MATDTFSIPESVGLGHGPILERNGQFFMSPKKHSYIESRAYGNSHQRISGVCGMSLVIYNFTDRAIAVYDSSNYLNIIEPITTHSASDISRGYPGTVFIECVYETRFDPLSVKDIIPYIKHRAHGLMRFDNKITKNLQSTLKHQVTYEDHLVGVTDGLTLTYKIENALKSLKNYGGAFYSEELDIVFDAMTRYDTILIHPRSSESILALADRPELSDNMQRMILEVKVNDPDMFYNKGFINISGSVYEVPVRRNRALPAGITVVTDACEDPLDREKFYDIDSADCPFKIYKSRQEALFNGDAAAIVESRNTAQKLEQQQKAHEAAMAKHEAEMRAIEVKNAQIEAANEEHKRRIAEQERILNAEREKLEESEKIRKRQQEDNERLEKSSYFRKVFVEVVKIVSTVVAAAATLAAAYLKFKKG